jgi:hypothetical protein
MEDTVQFNLLSKSQSQEQVENCHPQSLAERLSDEHRIRNHLQNQIGISHCLGALLINQIGSTTAPIFIGGDTCPRFRPGAFH